MMSIINVLVQLQILKLTVHDLSHRHAGPALGIQRATQDGHGDGDFLGAREGGRTYRTATLRLEVTEPIPVAGRSTAHTRQTRCTGFVTILRIQTAKTDFATAQAAAVKVTIAI